MLSPLIIALDYSSQQEALVLVEQLDSSWCALKVGSELFTLAGASFVKILINKGFRVFLDLKFHDIPHTVAKVCKVAAELGVWMINVHASGGERMMGAARDAIDSIHSTKPILIAVTILTSFNQYDLNAVGIKTAVQDQVLKLALLAKNSGLDGVVCSALEAKNIKQTCGPEFITVTPGIRLKEDYGHDQSRIMTPEQAVREGSDYLVMGRSITLASNPVMMINHVLKTLLP